MNHTLSSSSNNIALLSTITTTLTVPYQHTNASFTESFSSTFTETTSDATPAITVTQTRFKTSTVLPLQASSLPLPSFAAIPLYTTTTFTTSITTSIKHDPQSTQLSLFPFDDGQSPWHQLFPALIVFALLGMLAILTCLLLCLFCVYRRYRPQKEERHEEQRTQSTMLDTHWQHDGSGSSPHFVPIASSPLTLVPRAAIWKDPERRRGVNEMDLWEQRRQQQQSQHEQLSVQPPSPPEHAHPLPFLAQENQDLDSDSGDSYLDDGRDRPWQRYMQHQQQNQVSDLARAITVAAFDDNNSNDDQHSTQTSSFGSVFHSRLDSMGDQIGSINRSSSR